MDSIKSVHVGVVWYEQAQKAMRDVDHLRADNEAKDAEIAEFSSAMMAEEKRAIAAEARVKELEEQRARLWMLLDDIDTAEDMFKPTIGPHFKYVNKKHRQRFKVWNPANDGIGAYKHVSRIAELEHELAEAKREARDVADDYQDIGRELYTELEENERLTAELAEAKKDTARLDWLIGESLRIPTEGEEREPFPGDGDETVMLFVAESVEEISERQYQADVRAVIDEAGGE